MGKHLSFLRNNYIKTFSIQTYISPQPCPLQHCQQWQPLLQQPHPKHPFPQGAHHQQYHIQQNHPRQTSQLQPCRLQNKHTPQQLNACQFVSQQSFSSPTPKSKQVQSQQYISQRSFSPKPPCESQQLQPQEFTQPQSPSSTPHLNPSKCNPSSAHSNRVLH